MHRAYPPWHPNMQNLGDIVIRPAEVGDALGISQCLAAAFEPYRTAYSPGAFADTVPDGPGIVERLERMHVVVACSGGKVVGTLGGFLENGEGHLRGMAVLPEFRGSGLAATLLRTTESWLRDNGCKHVTLGTTVPLQTAIRFYEKNGYRRSGRVEDYFGMALVEYVKELV